MSVIPLPAALEVARMSWVPFENQINFSSPFNKGGQSIKVSDTVWMVSLQMPPIHDVNAGEIEAFLLRLRGRTNQVALHKASRPAPVGTMRGSMTLSGAHARGATVLTIAATGQNGTTLVAGDMLGLGAGTTQQVVMVVIGGTANTAGITVTVESPLRNDFASGASVTWDKPAALFRNTQPLKFEYLPGIIVHGYSLELIEDWNA